MSISIDERLKACGFHGLAENLGLMSEHHDVIRRIVDIEESYALQKKHRRIIDQSGIAEFTSMSLFDWSWPSMIERSVIESCMNQEYFDKKRNIIIIGPQGVGKTMIAKNIAMCAMQKGIRTVMTSASALLSKLASEAAKQNVSRLDRLFKKYSTIPLLVIDEIGYISYAASYGDLLFQLISQRHEKNSTIITTNMKLSQWNIVFPNTNSLAPMVDRLVQHSEIVKIEGPSWRMKERCTPKCDSAQTSPKE